MHPPIVARLLGSLLACVPLAAHGGQYRGPGSVAPPSTNSGSSAGPSSTATGSNGSDSGPAPTSPGPSAPGSAAPPAGASAGVAGAASRGAPLGDDLTRWEFWWEFGTDPYLHLREQLARARGYGDEADALLNPARARGRRAVQSPTDVDRAAVAGALFAALKQTDNRDMASGCLVALGKIGSTGTADRLNTAVLPFLGGNDQELRETAALAIGIAGVASDDSVDLLVDLARDAAPGREATAHYAVNERTRAFAVFGLGLLLQRNRQPAPAHRIVGTLTDLIADPSTRRDLTVAAIEALGLFPRNWNDPAASTLRDSIVDALGAYYQRPLGPGHQLVQAHAPTAMGYLLAPDTKRAAMWRRVFAAELDRDLDTRGPADRREKSNAHIAQSCALALGWLCTPWNDKDDDSAEIGDLLVRVYRSHRDHQTRSFALVALARMGGERARDALLRELQRANQAIEQPWCAMALGVFAARAMRDEEQQGRRSDPDRTITVALRDKFAKARTPAALGSLAIALGLSQDSEAAPRLRETLADNAHRDDLAGYLAMGLALMNDRDAIPPLRDLLAHSQRRPLILQQCARALGILGDYAVVEELCRQLEAPDSSLARLSAIAAALSQIQDRRSIDPLLAMLHNERLTPLTRAFAAVALGGICDKDPVPWNAAYATACNYRAATETLTDGAAGILDIL
jgi:hypothetical protein